MGEVISEEITEARWLAAQGIDVEAGPNLQLRNLYDPLARFSSQFMNQAPNQNETRIVLPTARDLRRVLAEGGGDADPRVVQSGWTSLLGACAAIAGARWLEGDQETAEFVCEVLLKAARHDLPLPDAELNQQYEEHGFFSQSPRWHAAAGLLDLVQLKSMADEEVLAAIRTLSADPCTEVRCAVAHQSVALYKNSPDTFWFLLHRITAEESSRRTIHYALTGVTQLARRHPEELRVVGRKVFFRFRADTRASDVRCDCLNIIAAADARGPNPYGDELIGIVISNMAGLTDEAVHLVQIAADSLTIGLGEQLDDGADRFRTAS
jgi:hypothetical protein